MITCAPRCSLAPRLVVWEFWYLQQVQQFQVNPESKAHIQSVFVDLDPFAPGG